jgi:hypothetical protein
MHASRNRSIASTTSTRVASTEPHLLPGNAFRASALAERGSAAMPRASGAGTPRAIAQHLPHRPSSMRPSQAPFPSNITVPRRHNITGTCTVSTVAMSRSFAARK